MSTDSKIKSWRSAGNADAARVIRHRWASVRRMLKAAYTQSRRSESELRRLLAQSDLRLGLKDPLWTDTLHRWLSEEREEAYSDWLEWTLRQLSGSEVLRVLGITDASLLRSLKSKLQIEREFVIRRGAAEDKDGRLDLVLRFDDDSGTSDAVFVVEVKTKPPDKRVADQARRYFEWLQEQQVRLKRGRQAILILIDAVEEEQCPEFCQREWADVCIVLRRILPKLMLRSGLPLATVAMLTAFIGAIEQNLLHFRPPEKGRSAQSLVYGRTADHIRQSLRKSE